LSFYATWTFVLQQEQHTVHPISMRRFLAHVLIAVVIAIVACTTLLKAQEQPKPEQPKQEERKAGEPKKAEPRIRREPPTVVTVEGKRSEVAVHEAEKSQEERPNVGKRIVKGAWKGIVGAVGWAFNTDEDIPSDRERKDHEQQK
jgi:hypothetical protein